MHTLKRYTCMLHESWEEPSYRLQLCWVKAKAKISSLVGSTRRKTHELHAQNGGEGNCCLRKEWVASYNIISRHSMMTDWFFMKSQRFCLNGKQTGLLWFVRSMK